MAIDFNLPPTTGAINFSRNSNGGHSVTIDVHRLAQLSANYQAGRISPEDFQEGLQGSENPTKLSDEYLLGLTILEDRRDLGCWSRSPDYLLGAVGDVDFMVVNIEKRFFWNYLVHSNHAYSKSAHGPYESELEALIDMTQNIHPAVVAMLGDQQHY